MSKRTRASGGANTTDAPEDVQPELVGDLRVHGPGRAEELELVVVETAVEK